ncbi:MAG: hypothetical protein PHH82_04170 [Candidatus ainarchaeum sp.]|nr:hypothetical protein [Candidatus ainarchaeum sp.]
MYDDAPAGPDPLASYADSGSGSGFFAKIKAHSEVWIPLVLIIILFLFLSVYFGLIDAKSVPLVGGLLSSIMGDYKQILLVGQPWDGPYQNDTIVEIMQQGLNGQKYKIKQIESSQNFSHNPENQIKNYDLIILDQTMLSDKSIPPDFANALIDYVFAGGKLIIVGDSATFVTGRPEKIGLPATFNESMAPVDCMSPIDGGPKCTMPIPLPAGIWYNTYETKLFQGIDKIPPNPLTQGLQGLPFTVFDVSPQGDEWAYIQDVVSGKIFTGIVKNGYGVGKVIYINYQEVGLTPSVLEYVVEELIG